jgi:hypothetical protein
VINFEVRVTNRGGAADEHRIRLVDAAEMYAGLSRAISYCLLSLEPGVLVHRATRVSDVQLYQRRTSAGSVVHALVVEIAQHPGAFYAGIVGSVLSDYLTKFIDFCFRSTIDKLDESAYKPRLAEFKRIEPVFEELTVQLEPHLLAVHAPIQQNETIAVSMGDFELELDKETKDYLSGINVSRSNFQLTGEVTRLNVVTGNGRFFLDDLGHIVPFSQTWALRDQRDSKDLSWSLRQRDQGLPGDVQLTAKKITSNTGRLKRLIVESVKRVR